MNEALESVTIAAWQVGWERLEAMDFESWCNAQIDRTSRANSLAGGQADTRSAHLTTVSILFLRMVDRYLMPQGGER